MLSEYIIILVTVIMIPCVRSNNRGGYLKFCGLTKGNIIEYQISKEKHGILLKSYLLIAGLIVRESPIKIEYKFCYSMSNFNHSFRQYEYLRAWECIIKSFLKTKSFISQFVLWNIKYSLTYRQISWYKNLFIHNKVNSSKPTGFLFIFALLLRIQGI